MGDGEYIHFSKMVSEITETKRKNKSEFLKHIIY